MEVFCGVRIGRRFFAWWARRPSLPATATASRATPTASTGNRVWDEKFEAVNAPVIHVNVRRLRKLLEADWENPCLILPRYNQDGESG